MSAKGSSQLVRVFIPDIKAQKCIVLDINDTVWAAKQVVLDKIIQELPNDPLNYGLYLPASSIGKLGKFLNDGLLLSYYALEGSIPRLEMRYKRRDFSRVQPSLTDKSIIKANSKGNQKKLLEYISSGSVKKIEKLLESGLDPNYVTEDGNTPLGIACGRSSNVSCIAALLSGGAHLDFRGKDGLTPMHRGALGGNAQAISILLSYGASPNCLDAKGLTPLFHAAIMGDNTGACITLLRHRAEIGTQDQGGWTELHHTSKYGHIEHAGLFIRYGAGINAQNLVGNTPLHVAVSYGQAKCAMFLLKRGIDRNKVNFAGQTPSQVAILCGHHQLASSINAFNENQIEPIRLNAEYNPNAPIYTPKMFVKRDVSDTCPTRPPDELLVGTLAQEWSSSSQPLVCPQDEETKRTPNLAPLKKKTSIASISSHASSVRVPDSGVGDTESISSVEIGSTYSGGTGTPTSGTPTFRRPSFQNQRERLYKAGPGKYTAIQDVEPQLPGDLVLRKGMTVEVTYIGKGGYWEGKCDGSEGWFPRLAIKEVGSEDSPQPTPPQPRSFSDSELKQNGNSQTQYETRKSSIREVVIVRSNKGYGFAMRGVRATTSMQFHPSPQVPALQYIGNVESGGPAAEVGLKTGDFIIEVNGRNVIYSTHDEVVCVVKASGGTLRMKINTPLVKTKSVSQQIKGRMTPVGTPETRHKSPTPNALQYTSRKVGEPSDKETIIGEERLQFGYSPNLPRANKSDWDLSQEDDSPGPQSQAGFSYHVPATNSTKTYSQVKTYPISQLSVDNPAQESPDFGSPRKHVLQKGSTMPALPTKDYPRLQEYASSNDSSDSDDEEDQSAFALALRKGKEQLEHQGGDNKKEYRPRAYTAPGTPPLRGSPLVNRQMAQTDKISSQDDQTLSPLQQQILKANKDRSERIMLNQPRLTGLSGKEKSNNNALKRNPLARAMSEKIDSIYFDTADFGGSDEEYNNSPYKSPQRIAIPKAKSVSNDNSEGALKGSPKVPPPATKPKPKKQMGEATPPVSRREEQSPSPLPWEVKLKSTPKQERKQQHTENKAEEGIVDWKSVLKPASTSKESPHISKQPSAPDIQPANNQGLSMKKISVESQSSFQLPPPLPVIEEKFMTFVEIAPPVDFSTESEDVLLPNTLPSPSNSPLPPPLPDSSPPPKPPTSTPDIFIFPEVIGNTSSQPAHSREVSRSPELPSPLVSPKPTSVNGDRQLSTSPLTPPVFGVPSERPASPTGSDRSHLTPLEGSSKWSPDSNTSDTPPPLPNMPPPPLDLEESSELVEEKPPTEVTNITAAHKTETSSVLTPPRNEGNVYPSQSPHTKPKPKRKTDRQEQNLSPPPVTGPPSNLSEASTTTTQNRIAPEEPPSQPKECFKTPEPLEETKKLQEEPQEEKKPPAVSDEAASYKDKALEDWDSDDVREWLKDIGLGEHAESFAENEIVGEHLLDLSKDDLKELGVKKLGHQKTFNSKLSQISKS